MRPLIPITFVLRTAASKGERGYRVRAANTSADDDYNCERRKGKKPPGRAQPIDNIPTPREREKNYGKEGRAQVLLQPFGGEKGSVSATPITFADKEKKRRFFKQKKEGELTISSSLSTSALS